jgi:hypothetical protein
VSVASSLYRLPACQVLVGVLPSPQGPSPLPTEVDGARANLLDDRPRGHREWLLANTRPFSERT